MIRMVLLCTLIMVGCNKGSVDSKQIKITGAPAIIVGKLLRIGEGEEHAGCYLVVQYQEGHRLAGQQEPVKVDEVVYKYAKINNVVYIGVSVGGTPMLSNYLEQ